MTEQHRPVLPIYLHPLLDNADRIRSSLQRIADMSLRDKKVLGFVALGHSAEEVRAAIHAEVAADAVSPSTVTRLVRTAKVSCGIGTLPSFPPLITAIHASGFFGDYLDTTIYERKRFYDYADPDRPGALHYDRQELPGKVARLSPMQADTAGRLIGGSSISEIAAIHGSSINAVDIHRTAVYDRLGLQRPHTLPTLTAAVFIEGIAEIHKS
jgi:DNA-binding CsgD family transcriptional regulator